MNYSNSLMKTVTSFFNGLWQANCQIYVEEQKVKEQKDNFGEKNTEKNGIVRYLAFQ